MSSNGLFRIAGYAAALCAVITAATVGLGIGVNMNNPLFFVGIFVSSILLLLVVYALYVVHRTESPQLALGAFVATAIGDIGSLFVDPTAPANAIPFGLVTLLFGIGLLLFSLLAHRSSQMQKGMSVVVFLFGALSVLSGILFVIGLFQLAWVINFASVIPLIGWTGWLGMHFLSHKLVTT
jgi:hypothetical protein